MIEAARTALELDNIEEAIKWCKTAILFQKKELAAARDAFAKGNLEEATLRRKRALDGDRSAETLLASAISLSDPKSDEKQLEALKILAPLMRLVEEEEKRMTKTEGGKEEGEGEEEEEAEGKEEKGTHYKSPVIRTVLADVLSVYGDIQKRLKGSVAAQLSANQRAVKIDPLCIHCWNNLGWYSLLILLLLSSLLSSRHSSLLVFPPPLFSYLSLPLESPILIYIHSTLFSCCSCFSWSSR
jgi:hypothetical protein